MNLKINKKIKANFKNGVKKKKLQQRLTNKMKEVSYEILFILGFLTSEAFKRTPEEAIFIIQVFLAF